MIAKGGTMKIFASLGLLVFLTSLSLPLSAEAFGRRPSSSEVYQNQQPPAGPVAPNTPRNDTNRPPIQAVPEPSSILLLGLGLAVSLVALVSMRKWLHRAAEK